MSAARCLSSRIQSENSPGCDTSFSNRNESFVCTKEEKNKERGHYEIVSLTFHKPVWTRISEMQKFIYKENDEARPHQATGGNTINMSTQRVSICLFISVYFSINYLTMILSWQPQNCSPSNACTLAAKNHSYFGQSAFATTTRMNPFDINKPWWLSTCESPSLTACSFTFIIFLGFFFPWEKVESAVRGKMRIVTSGHYFGFYS